MRKIVAIMLALTVVLPVTGCREEVPGEPEVTQTPHEDEPGFNCKKHGNKDCGPGYKKT